MSKIHITLVGGQTEPEYLGIIDEKPNKVVFVCSEQSKEDINKITACLEKCTYDTFIIDPVNIVDIEKKFTELYETYSDNEVSINLTSGTKIWSIIVYSVFSKHKNVKFLYIDQNNNVTNIINKESHKMHMDVDMKFRLNGNELNHYKDFNIYTKEDFDVLKKIGEIRDFNYISFGKLTNPLEHSQQSLLNQTTGEFRLNDESYVLWNWQEKMVEISLFDKTRTNKTFILKSPNVASIVFHSGWFELMIANYIVQNPNTQHVWMNCEFFSKSKDIAGNRTKNEIDIIAEMGTRLLFIECKTKISKINDIDKFKSAVGNYGGLGSKCIFVTYFKPSEIAIEKCKDHSIPIFNINFNSSDDDNKDKFNEFVNNHLTTINRK